MAKKSEPNWKPVEVDPQFFSDIEFRNLVCIEEITDYKVENGQIIFGSDSQQKEPKRKLSQNSAQKKKKRKKAKLDKNGDISEKKVLADKNNTEPPKPKGKVQPTTKALPDMGAWTHLPVPELILQAMAEQGFTVPTPIQNECLIPAIMYKQDIIGAAATGSGKTLAFGIPILYNIMEDEQIEESKSKTLEIDIEKDGNEKSLASVNEYDEKSNDENKETFEEDSGKQDVGISDMAVNNELLEDEVEEDDVFKKFTASQIPDDDGLKALILTPTRELAMQVKNHLIAVAKYTKIKVVAIIGGMSEQRQERILKKRPDIIVATPGRFWELYQKRNPYVLTVKNIRYLVIDEADRMVEKGHFEELQKLLSILRRISKLTQKRRQTFLFSATLTLAHTGPQRKLSKKFEANLLTTEGKIRMLMYKLGMKKGAKMVDLTGKTRTAETLSEAKVLCEREKKDVHLYYFLKQHPGRTLVFCNSKDCIRRLVSIFTLLECQPLPLHSDMHQKQRLKNLERFSSNSNALLLATDIAARGLDIPKVDHVIHFQVPHTTENYIHRSGRTARASLEGLTVLLICPEEQKGYRKILYSLDRSKDFDQFPVDNSYMPSINVRVQLALKIDTEEHRSDKRKHENNWFRKAAEEMDIELDEENLYNLGDSKDQADLRHKIASMKMQLQMMLKTKLISKKCVTKYPTKTGKLHELKETSNSSSAISELRRQNLSKKEEKKQKRKIVIKDVNELKKNNLNEKKRKKAMRRKKRKEQLMMQFKE